MHHYLLAKFFFHMTFPVKHVQTLKEQLRIIKEVGKNPPEKRTDVAK
jgi:hypothetical protein